MPRKRKGRSRRRGAGPWRPRTATWPPVLRSTRAHAEAARARPLMCRACRLLGATPPACMRGQRSSTVRHERSRHTRHSNETRLRYSSRVDTNDTNKHGAVDGCRSSEPLGSHHYRCARRGLNAAMLHHPQRRLVPTACRPHRRLRCNSTFAQVACRLQVCTAAGCWHESLLLAEAWMAGWGRTAGRHESRRPAGAAAQRAVGGGATGDASAVLAPLCRVPHTCCTLQEACRPASRSPPRQGSCAPQARPAWGLRACPPPRGQPPGWRSWPQSSGATRSTSAATPSCSPSPS